MVQIGVPERRSGPIFQLGTPQSAGSLGRHTDSNNSCNDEKSVTGLEDASSDIVVPLHEDGWPPAALVRRIHELEQQLTREKEHRRQLVAANQQLTSENEQLLQRAETSQQLTAESEQLRQLVAANEKLRKENEQLRQLASASQQMAVENEQLRQQLAEQTPDQQHVNQLVALEQDLKTKKNTIELLVTEKSELESKVCRYKNS